MATSGPTTNRDNADPTAVVFNVMRYATHDGPGIRTAVFFKGCPLSCSWCHNPEGQSFRPEVLYFEERCHRCGECVEACPQHAIELDGVPRTGPACRRCGLCAEVCRSEARQLAGRRVSLGELVREIERDVIFFDESGGGVTLSGGEPLAQPRFAAALLGACRERGIDTVVETCGYAAPVVFQEVAALAGAVFFDLKLIDPEKHRRYTGVRNHMILRNLGELAARGRAVTVRIPVIPGINDAAEDVDQFARYLAELRVPVELLPYHHIGAGKYKRLGRNYELEDTAGDLARFSDILVEAGLTVTVRGDRT